MKIKKLCVIIYLFIFLTNINGSLVMATFDNTLYNDLQEKQLEEEQDNSLKEETKEEELEKDDEVEGNEISYNELEDNNVTNTEENNSDIMEKVEIKNSEPIVLTQSIMNLSQTETPKQTISDGTYVIQSALNRNKLLEIAGGSNNNYANVQLWDNIKSDQQKFTVKYLHNGYYSIISTKSQKALDVAGGYCINGANVQQYEVNGTEAQQWIIKELEDGYYSIISRCNGLYLDVNYASTANGTNIQVYETNSSSAQKFKFIKAEEFNGTKTIENGTYVIKSAVDTSRVLDIQGASTVSRANLQIWENANGFNQKFIITYIGSGYYTIENFYSGKVLDVEGALCVNGANVQQYEGNGTNAQKWVIKDNGDGSYSIISRCGGLYLDLTYASSANGTNVQIYEGNGTNAQKFKFEKADNLSGTQSIQDGMYIIASKLDSNKVLDVTGASQYIGANIQIWDCFRTKQQKFSITYLGNGFYKIKNVNSTKVLDVAGGVIANGANVQQYDSNGSNAQQWIIKEVEKGCYSIISRCGGLCLDIAYGSAANGGNVQVYKNNGTDAQKFQLIKAETNGIDVSQFQGNINWSGVKDCNIDFAFLRVGYRGYRTGEIVSDTMFQTNLLEATSNGINCGVYFVTQATNYYEGVEEANWVLDNIKGYSITCPIVIDVEWAGGGKGNNGRADNITIEDRTQAIKGFCDTIQKAGYTPMIYANKEWLINYLNMSILSNYYVWLAHYVKGAPEQTSDYMGNYLYWQYTSQGFCNGIKGYVDLSKGY